MKLDNGNVHQTLTAQEAAVLVIESEASIASMGLPDSLGEEFIVNVGMAIYNRRKTGFEVNPLSKIEVPGLVDAAMGSYDHLMGARKALIKYTVGLLQTNTVAVTQTRDRLAKEK